MNKSIHYFKREGSSVASHNAVDLVSNFIQASNAFRNALYEALDIKPNRSVAIVVERSMSQTLRASVLIEYVSADGTRTTEDQYILEAGTKGIEV